MNDESPENIAENEAIEEMHVFCRWLKQEYGRLESCKTRTPSSAPSESPRDSSTGGSSGALTSLSIVQFTTRHGSRQFPQFREAIGFDRLHDKLPD